MSNIFRISFDKIRSSHLRGALTDLENGLRETGLDFYLIGAVARDIMMGVHGVNPQRATRDVDVAVLIPSKESYEKLISHLKETGNFKTIEGSPYTLTHKGRTEIDLLPFGALNIEGKNMIGATGMTTALANGFEEVYEAATESVILDEHEYRVCTLPGIVILKLIAYDDRPEMRVKDVYDIVSIVENYFNIVGVEIYDRHHDLLTTDNFNTLLIGSRLLGRHMEPVLDRSEALRERIKKILEQSIQNPQSTKLAELMTRDTVSSFEDALAILREILAGINEARQKKREV